MSCSALFRAMAVSCFRLFYFLGNFLDWPTKRNLKQHAETLVKGLAVTWLTHPQLLLLPPNLFRKSAHNNDSNNIRRTHFRIMRKYRFSYFCRMFLASFHFSPFDFGFLHIFMEDDFFSSNGSVIQLRSRLAWTPFGFKNQQRCGMPCDVSAFY